MTGRRHILRTVWGLGYNGLEIAVQFSSPKELAAFKEMKKRVSTSAKEIVYVAQIHTCGYPISSSSVEKHLDSFKTGIETALLVEPRAINVHSGKDSWTIDQTLEYFRKVEEFTRELQVQVNHETHRQRALFTPYVTAEVIKQCPRTLINADLSHWVIVGERLYSKQFDPEFFTALDVIMPNIRQIHARVGSANTIQVLDVTSPLEKENLAWFEAQWKSILTANSHLRDFYITCEFGPLPYAQLDPRTSVQINDTVRDNDFLVDRLKEL